MLPAESRLQQPNDELEAVLEVLLLAPRFGKVSPRRQLGRAETDRLCQLGPVFVPLGFENVHQNRPLVGIQRAQVLEGHRSVAKEHGQEGFERFEKGLGRFEPRRPGSFAFFAGGFGILVGKIGLVWLGKPGIVGLTEQFGLTAHRV